MQLTDKEKSWKSAIFFVVWKKRSNFATDMTIEFNEVVLRGEEYTLSLLAREGCLTCITGGSAVRRTRCLLALMGFEAPTTGYVSVDGEPLTGGCIAHLRRNIAFVPASLETVGEIVTYEPPTVNDMLSLRSNSRLKVSAAALRQETERTGAAGQKGELLAAAVLRRKPVLVVDSPSVSSAGYLQRLAKQEGMTVIAATGDAEVLGCADSIVELE